MKKRKILYTFFIVLICLFALIQVQKLYDESRSYSSTEILGFKKMDNATLKLRETSDTPRGENEPLIIDDIVISKEIEQELINSFKDAKFKKYNEFNLKYQYFVTFNVDSESSFYLNLDDGVIYMSEGGNYVFEDDNHFLNTFKEAIK